MTDDYLWDRSGPTDADVEALERALAPYAHVAPRQARGGLSPSKAARRTSHVARGTTHVAPGTLHVARDVIYLLSTAATLLLVAYAGYVGSTDRDTAWRVSTLGGDPRVNDRLIGRSATWHVGDRLETDARSVAQIDVGDIGNVEVGPNSHVTLVRARLSQHRVALEHGTIRAIIWAPPGLFVVDTPSAVAVDLGCAYSLEVGTDGAGLLQVEHGWVGFRDNGRESFIPQGALCPTRRGRGPGTPYYEDAPSALVAALLALDFGDARDREPALTAALRYARSRDALSLWHLLSRTVRDDRGRVFDRLVALAPPPAGVTRDGVLSGDRRMLDAWWDTLGLESASWWRMWETPWPR